MFENDFEQLLRKYSDAIEIRSRFAGLVKDYFPEQQKSVNLILTAYEVGLPEAIRDAVEIDNAFAYRYVKKLVDDYGISRINADWVVSVWCVCYGKRVLSKKCEIQIASGKVNGEIAIQEDSKLKSYNDLFVYEKSKNYNGYAVVGFNGENKKTIIFQNEYRNNRVVEIKEQAFQEYEIEEAIMTDGYVSIGERAFQGCVNMRQIILPSTLKEIKSYALQGCVNLKSIIIPQMTEIIGDYTFADTGLKSVIIPKTVLYLGKGLFSGCHNLDTVLINENILDVPECLFQNCTKLKKIRLHEKMQTIGDYSFDGCTELKELYVPDSVIAIGEHAFDNLSEKFLLQCNYGSFAETFARNKKINYQLV